MMDINDMLRGGGEDDVRNQFDQAWLKRRAALDEVHKVFRKWLSDDYDCDLLDIVLATRASHELDGITVWLLVVSGSGGCKTETVSALRETDVHIISTIASEGALLSASPKKGRAKTATGGLLRVIGGDGVLVVKDFTSILSMQSVTRAPMLAALREIFDGVWVRNVGSDGGQTLTWEGRITLIGACTTSWDEHHGVIATMGDRFALVRFDSSKHRDNSASQSIRNGGREPEMQKELAGAARAVIDGMSREPITMSTQELDTIISIADVVTFARTGVVTDYRGDVVDGHMPEAPTRFAKQLAQLYCGAVAIGHGREKAMALVKRCGHDTIPPSRLMVLLDVEANPGGNVAEIAKRLRKPFSSTKRCASALTVLGLLRAEDRTDGTAGFWLGQRLNTKGFAHLKD
ncbi:ArsR family transcriptional regulator [Ensifer sp. WSM1721]|uniref:ArsR family transcriptional regulator n=1 Tax=Ensifer sp. WSM1721 TaxID=1041159 RepID=UPI003524C191